MYPLQKKIIKNKKLKVLGLVQGNFKGNFMHFNQKWGNFWAKIWAKSKKPCGHPQCKKFYLENLSRKKRPSSLHEKCAGFSKKWGTNKICIFWGSNLDFWGKYMKTLMLWTNPGCCFLHNWSWGVVLHPLPYLVPMPSLLKLPNFWLIFANPSP